jgi:hypothetical protein
MMRVTKVLAVALLMIGCGRLSPVPEEYSEATRDVLREMSRPEWECFRDWSLSDRSAADQWLEAQIAERRLCGGADGGCPPRRPLERCGLQADGGCWNKTKPWKYCAAW